MSASCRRLMPFAHPPSAQSLIVTLKSLIGITSCLAVRTLTTTRYSAPPIMRPTEVPLMAAEPFFEDSWNRISLNG
jgi:hypothetical protein